MRYFLFFILTLVGTSAEAQFNSKVGYSAMYLNMDKVTDLFHAFNDANSETLADDLSSIKFSHGLELGARYRISNLSFEIGVISGQGETKAISTSGEEFKWKASMFDYHLNVTQHFNNLGIGAGVANQQVRLRQFNSITSNFDDTTHEQQWSARIFFQIEVPSRAVSFALRPYYQFSFDGFATDAVANALAVPNVGNQDLKLFGLSVLFFNGPQVGW